MLGRRNGAGFGERGKRCFDVDQWFGELQVVDFGRGVDDGHGGVSVTEFKYRFSAGQSANILWSAGVSDKQAATALVARLNGAGMPTLDISDIDAAQVHLRHLVGGRARSYMGEIPFERMFQVRQPCGSLLHGWIGHGIVTLKVGETRLA